MLKRMGWSLAVGIAAAACSNGTGPSGGDGGAVGRVTVGNIFFQSGRNGTRNPARDTVPAGTVVTWTWTGTKSTPHSVASTESPAFTSSDILTGSGNTHAVSFTSPGTYTYECAVHGSQMTGTIVVQ